MPYEFSAEMSKTRITIRLDNEIIDWFRNRAETRSGGNYQTTINNALRECINNRGESLEEIVRRVLREEYQKLYLRIEPIFRSLQTAENRPIRKDISDVGGGVIASTDSTSTFCVPVQIGTIH